MFLDERTRILESRLASAEDQRAASARIWRKDGPLSFSSKRRNQPVRAVLGSSALVVLSASTVLSVLAGIDVVGFAECTHEARATLIPRVASDNIDGHHRRRQIECGLPHPEVAKDGHGRPIEDLGEAGHEG